MNKRWRTRVLSGALSVAMLASMAPMALAASYDVTGEFDNNLECYLFYDLDGNAFDNLWDEYSYFMVESDENYAPGVYVDGRGSDVEGDILYYNDSHDDYYSIQDVYIDADDADENYDDAYYDYTIYASHSEKDAQNEDWDDYITLRVYNDSSSSSDDIEVTADTDSDGTLNLDDVIPDIYRLANAELPSNVYPARIEFTGVSNGSIEDQKGNDAEDTEYSINEKFLTDDTVKFEITSSSKSAQISFIVYGDKSGSANRVYGTIYINGSGSSSSTKGDIYADLDSDGTLDMDDICSELYKFGDDDMVKAYPTYVEFTSFTNGYLTYQNGDRDAEDIKFYFDDDGEMLKSETVIFEIKDDSKEATINFTVGNNSSERVSGVIVINSDGSTTVDKKTVVYTGAKGDAVEFSASDFEAICDEVSSYDLNYVKFSLPSSSKGTLYAEYDGTTKGSDEASASDKFYVDPSSSQYGLDDVVFVPDASGTIQFSYTAYTTKGTSFSGKVQVNVTAGTLQDITYSTRTTGGITFNGADFASVLKSKSSSATLDYVTFTLPASSMGTLYYNYNSLSGNGTAVSASTQYKNSTSGNSLSKVTFVPRSGLTGTVTINYTAKDTRGNLYSGAVKLNITPGEDRVLTYSSNGRAVTFTNADFRLACTSKLGTTLDYVRFTLPNSSQGTLYYGYRSNQETRVSPNANYMSNTHLDFISFVPKANYSGTATINYTGYDVNGNSYNGTIQVQVTQPTRSSYFTDATESWIIPASDFLNAYGVYSGVVSGATLGVRNQATRGEVMQMIYNAFNLKNEVTSVTSHFTDVPATHPYYTAINAANQLGVALGDQGMFRPNEAITRQDAMTLLYRAFTKLGVPMSTGTASDLMAFGDYAKVDSYATDALASMVKSGIIQGDNGMINPKGNVTRGEISVMLYRAMTL